MVRPPLQMLPGPNERIGAHFFAAPPLAAAGAAALAGALSSPPFLAAGAAGVALVALASACFAFPAPAILSLCGGGRVTVLEGLGVECAGGTTRWSRLALGSIFIV
jgi:hypothetical protein